jgi:hypothetical protein
MLFLKLFLVAVVKTTCVGLHLVVLSMMVAHALATTTLQFLKFVIEAVMFDGQVRSFKTVSTPLQCSAFKWSECWHHLPHELFVEIMVHLARDLDGQAALNVCKGVRANAFVARYEGILLKLKGFTLLDHPHSTFRTTTLQFDTLKVYMWMSDSTVDTLYVLAHLRLHLGQLHLVNDLISSHQRPYSSLPQRLLDSIVSLSWKILDTMPPSQLVEQTTFPNLRQLSMDELGSYIRQNEGRSFSFPALKSFTVSIATDKQLNQFYSVSEIDELGPLCLEQFFKLNQVPDSTTINLELESFEVPQVLMPSYERFEVKLLNQLYQTW